MCVCVCACIKASTISSLRLPHNVTLTLRKLAVLALRPPERQQTIAGTTDFICPQIDPRKAAAEILRVTMQMRAAVSH